MVCDMANSPSETVAANLRAELARRDLSQASFALQLGITQSQLSKRLRGRIEFGVDEIHKIAAALDVPVATLMPTAVAS